MKGFARLVLISCALLVLASCHKIIDKDSLCLNLSSEPSTLDWNKASDAFSFDVISNLMQGLTRYKQDAQGHIGIEPLIAKSWKINAKQDEYIFYLDERAKWQDGSPVRAQQFIDSIERTLDPKTGAPYAELLSLIDLERSRALGERQLYIKLKKPAPYFIYMTAYALMLPIRKDLIERYGSDWTEPGKLVTNGPYRLTKWQHEYKIELTRSEAYWREPAKIFRIKFFMVPEQSQAFTLYRNQQLDLVDGRSIPSSEMRAFQNYDAKPFGESVCRGEHCVLRRALLRSTYVGFNTRKAPLNDVHLRRALFYSIDRNALVAALKRAYVASASWIPSGLPEYFHPELSDPDRAYDPDLARKELALSSYTVGQKLIFAFPSSEEARLISETLQAMWTRELGLEVELRSMEWKAYLNSLEHSPPDIFRLNWTADYPDPDSFMQIFMTHNPINYPAWSNGLYDHLIQEAARSPDTKLRQALYLQAEKLLLDNAVVAPLFTNTQTIIHRKNLENININAMDMLFLDRINK